MERDREDQVVVHIGTAWRGHARDHKQALKHKNRGEAAGEQVFQHGPRDIDCHGSDLQDAAGQNLPGD